MFTASWRLWQWWQDAKAGQQVRQEDGLQPDLGPDQRPQHCPSGALGSPSEAPQR